MDSKRGISPVIALVLLIAIGVAASGIVYNGVKNSIVPDEVEVISCPEATDLSIRSVACSTQNNLCLTIANKGKFSPDGYVLSADNRTPKSYDLYTINEDGSVVIPNEEKFINYSFPIEYYEDNVPLGNLDNVTYVQIQPFRYGDSGEKLLCDTVLYQDVVCEDSPIDCAQTCELDSDCEGSTYCEPLVCRNSQCVVENPILCNEPKVSEPYCGEDGNVYVDTTNFICSNELMNCEQSGPIPLIQGDPCEFGCDLGKCVVPTDETLDVMFIIDRSTFSQESDLLDLMGSIRYSTDFLDPLNHNSLTSFIAYGDLAIIKDLTTPGFGVTSQEYRWFGVPPISTRGSTFTNEKPKIDLSIDKIYLSNSNDRRDQRANMKQSFEAARYRFSIVSDGHDREDTLGKDFVILIAHKTPDVTVDYKYNVDDVDLVNPYCGRYDLECHRRYAAIEAQNLRDSGVEIYAIAVSNDETFNNFMRDEIASSPQTYYQVSNFGDELKNALIDILREKD